MTPTPTDSGLPAGEQNANSATSQPAGDQPNSQTPPTLEQYRAIAREEAIRAAQGVKDRRFDGITREQNNQRTLLDDIQAKIDANPGMTIAQAKREVRLDELLNDEPAPPASQGSGTGAPADDTVKRIIAKFSMDTNDPEVLQAIRGNSDIADLSFALSELRETRKSSPTPNLATNASPAGGTSVGTSLTSAQVEEKAGKLAKLLREPTVNQQAIAALQKELGPDYV